MIVMRVCGKCGWYDHEQQGSTRCDPDGGDACKKLLDDVGQPGESQLGCGTGSFGLVLSEYPSLKLILNTGRAADGEVAFS